MSSLIGRRSGNRGMCAQPCRMEYTMGGRLEDSHPLSLKDNCLVDRLREIEDAGVACAIRSLTPFPMSFCIPIRQNRSRRL